MKDISRRTKKAAKKIKNKGCSGRAKGWVWGAHLYCCTALSGTCMKIPCLDHNSAAWSGQELRNGGMCTHVCVHLCEGACACVQGGFGPMHLGVGAGTLKRGGGISPGCSLSFSSSVSTSHLSQREKSTFMVISARRNQSSWLLCAPQRVCGGSRAGGPLSPAKGRLCL